MLPRTLEPEVMDTAEEAVAYDSMDHREVNRLFADDFFSLLGLAGGAAPRYVPSLAILDVGTGTAQIPVEICSRRDDLKITGVDLSSHMLQLGLRNVIRAGLAEQIRLDQVDAKGLPYPSACFDAVISNSIIHHIPQPLRALREMRRLLRPDGWLFVRDLLRPATSETVDQLVHQYAGDADERQRELFRASLHAALTLDEVRGLLRELELDESWARQTSDRHWTIAGRLSSG